MTRVGVMLLAVALGVAALVTLRRRREESTPLPPQHAAADDDIDREELERAEREVRDLEHDGTGGPAERSPGDDWGPGAARRTPLP